MYKSSIVVFAALLLLMATACQHNAGECIPDCSDKTCGDDGCGGECGSCPSVEVCDGSTCTTCGNGELEEHETCDPSASVRCPQESGCVSDDACFVPTYTGSVDTCDAVCDTMQIIECVTGDGCCPAGCNPGNDVDCAPAECGNGTLDPGESCDPPDIPCVDECEATEACETAEFWGFEASCTLECRREPITVCSMTSDGCCPDDCTYQTDADCAEPVCGDGSIDGDETCDSAIPASDEGACPQTCDDNRACTNDLMSGSDCEVFCQRSSIVQCTGGDDCCPAGCTEADDPDCANVACGDGIVDGDEGCDNAIPAGEPGACPTDAAMCDDGDECTTDSLEGSAADCSARCINEEPACIDGDGCCPPACSPSEDADCAELELCPDYCFGAITYCRNEHELFSSTEECMAACAMMPVGEPDASSGDSIHCRIHHLEDARTDPEGHCEHSALEPLGGCE
jgi:hypothetical protein